LSRSRRRNVIEQVQPSPRDGTRLFVGDARGDYYGESAGSYMVKEFKYVGECGKR
jgi:hypothetical protein